jgi:hypothetical protein
MAFPDMWQEVALVAVSISGGSEIQFAAITETIEINEGDYPGEGMPNLAGGRIWKQSPQEDGEITLELLPLELDTTSGVGLFQQWTGGTWDTSEPLAADSTWAVGVTRVRDKFRVSILWTNDTTATAAAGATASATDALRFYATDCRITSHQSSFSPEDGLKTSVTFKYPAMNKAGTTRIGIWQSGDQTALVTLGSYS